MGSGAALAVTVPTNAGYDAAYAVSATGDDPLSSGPSAFSTSHTVREAVGSARSADGRMTVGRGRAVAGNGQASATAEDVAILGGAIHAELVTASCGQGNGAVRVSGGVVERLTAGTSVSYDVRRSNADGSTTVIGMQIRLGAGNGTVINVAAATCTGVTTY